MQAVAVRKAATARFFYPQFNPLRPTRSSHRLSEAAHSFGNFPKILVEKTISNVYIARQERLIYAVPISGNPFNGLLIEDDGYGCLERR